jgi:uncharacterized membrane protein YbhN (UPF0104 family)
MRQTLSLLAKLLIALAIFAGIFIEIGGGYVAVDAAGLTAADAFAVANPASPGLLGRLTLRLRGRPIPPPQLPASAEQACSAAAERRIWVRAADGTLQPIKAQKHCADRQLAHVFELDPAGRATVTTVPAAGQVYFRRQGFQLVPAELSELWAEIHGLSPRVFVFWFVAAMAIKLVGIFASILRWQVLLRGQGILLDFGRLTSTYFIGRYFGIVTPSTMGLDAWRLYETSRLTRRPVECTTVLAVERVVGLVGLFAVILGFMPFAGRLTRGQSFGELVGAMKVPLAGTLVFGVLILLRPEWFRALLRVVPSARVRAFTSRVVEAATAYRDHRGLLLWALVLAVVGQLTTTLMYFANAMSLGVTGVHPSEVLFASAVMTFGTFVAPSASGEGVRELVFVWLLGAQAGAAKAFLIGNLGFWIEKLPLSIPGGILLLLRKDGPTGPITKDDLERMRRGVGTELPQAR